MTDSDLGRHSSTLLAGILEQSTNGRLDILFEIWMRTPHKIDTFLGSMWGRLGCLFYSCPPFKTTTRDSYPPIRCVGPKFPSITFDTRDLNLQMLLDIKV